MESYVASFIQTLIGAAVMGLVGWVIKLQGEVNAVKIELEKNKLNFPTHTTLDKIEARLEKLESMITQLSIDVIRHKQ